MPKQIILTVAPDATTKLETKGFRGAACKAASKPYEDALGIATDDRPTAEARLPEQGAANRQQQGNS